MNKKFWKKMGLAVLTTVCTAAMGVTAFAAEGNTEDLFQAAGNTVVLKKAITVINHDGFTYEPSITYTYTLSNGSASGSVTDENGRTVNFKAGSTEYLTSAAVQTAVFSKDNEVDAGGAANASKDLSWSFDPSAFPSAGVYRFNLKETATSVDPEIIGIERKNEYDTDKFLDVYVQNRNGGLEIYGYILADDAETAVNPVSEKSQGWNAGDDLEQFETYNINITKNITGGGADLSAQFPFMVALTGELSGANIAVEGTGNDIALTEEGASAQLGNGKTLIVKGLPKTAAFAITEDNPTPDEYKATATVSGISGTTAAEGAALAGNAQDLSLVADGNIANAKEAIIINVENNLGVISPTGVVLRFGPYIAILAAGIALAAVLILKRRRREQED